MRQRYNDFQYTKLRFGKHKGKFMRDVPTDYLEWAIMNIQDGALASMFSVELQRRIPRLRKLK